MVMSLGVEEMYTIMTDSSTILAAMGGTSAPLKGGRELGYAVEAVVWSSEVKVRE